MPDMIALVRIGWIGTGIMGAPMAGHLLAAGHELRRLQPHALARRRAGRPMAPTWCDDPAAVAERAEVVFTMVGYPADVRDTVLRRRAAGDDRGLAARST